MQNPMWVSLCPPSCPTVPGMLVAPSPTLSPWLQCDGSITLLTAQHDTQPCHAVPSVPCCVVLCHAVLCCPTLCHAVSHVAARRPHCKPQVRAARRCAKPCAHATPSPQPRLRPPCPGRAGGTGPFPVTCPCGPLAGETVLQGHQLSQNHSCRC